MSWNRVAWLVAVAIAFSIYSMPSAIFSVGPGLQATPADYGIAFAGWFFRYLMMFAPVLVALTIADNVPVTGGKRIAVLAIALVISAQVQWPLRCTLEPQTEQACEGFPAFLLRSWWEMLPNSTLFTISFSGVIALAYFTRRRDIRNAKALHAAELARADVQRSLLEAELHTMRARVDPEFLLETLGDIGERFERFPASGSDVLDNLICYLRAALPTCPTRTSTLQQEVELARAYLGLLLARAGPALEVRVDFADALADRAVPPMTILPLLAATIDPSPREKLLPTRIRLDAIVDDGRLRIAITGRGPAVRDIGAGRITQDVRSRLGILYGGRASLTIDIEDASRLTLVLELPDESA